VGRRFHHGRAVNVLGEFHQADTSPQPGSAEPSSDEPAAQPATVRKNDAWGFQPPMDAACGGLSISGEQKFIPISNI